MDNVINAIIAEPRNGEVVKCSLKNPYITIKGVAVGDGGAGARIVKVEVSGD